MSQERRPPMPSIVPPTSGSVPAITLRRVGDPQPIAAMRDFYMFLRGQEDTITLTNVEVIERNQSKEQGVTDLDPIAKEDSSTPVPGTAAVIRKANHDNALELNTPRLPPPYVLPPMAQPSLPRSLDLGAPLAWDPRPRPFPGGYGTPGPPPVARGRRRTSHIPASISVICRVCLEQAAGLIHLDCGHDFCQPCLNELVRTCIAHRMSWPPRCCSGQLGLDIDAIRHHLDEDVIARYATVWAEYSDPDPIYCSNRVCSLHIPPNTAQNTKGQFVSCDYCQTETCRACKQGRGEHSGLAGAIYPTLEQLLGEEDHSLVKNQRWKQCPGCKNVVERNGGCNEIFCQCGVRFCYRCGVRKDRTQVPASGCGCSAFDILPPLPLRRDVLPGIMHLTARKNEAEITALTEEAASIISPIDRILHLGSNFLASRNGPLTDYRGPNSTPAPQAEPLSTSSTRLDPTARSWQPIASSFVGNGSFVAGGTRPFPSRIEFGDDNPSIALTSRRDTLRPGLPTGNDILPRQAESLRLSGRDDGTGNRRSNINPAGPLVGTNAFPNDPSVAGEQKSGR